MPKPEDRDASLPLGLYEQVVDRGIERLLGVLAGRPHEVELKVEPLDSGDSHEGLASHLRRAILETLDALAGEERTDRQLMLCNRVLSALEGVDDDRSLPAPARRLLAIWPKDRGRTLPERPDTP